MPYSNSPSEQKQKQRQLAQARKAAEKAAKEQYLDQRQETVNDLNTQLEIRLASLQSILKAGLQRTFKIEFKEIIQHSSTIPVYPGLPPQPPPKPEIPILPECPKRPEKPDVQKYRAQVPKPGILEKHTGVGKDRRVKQGKKIKQEYSEAVENFKKEWPIYCQLLEAWKQHKQQIEDEYARRLNTWQRVVQQQEDEYKNKLASREQAINQLKVGLFSKYPDAIEAFQRASSLPELN